MSSIINERQALEHYSACECQMLRDRLRRRLWWLKPLTYDQAVAKVARKRYANYELPFSKLYYETFDRCIELLRLGTAANIGDVYLCSEDVRTLGL